MDGNESIFDVIGRSAAVAAAAVGGARGEAPPPTAAVAANDLAIAFTVGTQALGKGNAAKSPCGITGDKLTRPYLNFDWFNFTFPSAMVIEVEQMVSKFIGSFEGQTGGINTYKCHKRSSSKAVIAWSDGRKEAWLSLNGDSVELIPANRLREFFNSMEVFGAKATRIDIAANFPRHLLDVDWVHVAANSRQVVGFRRYDPRKPMKDMQTYELEGNQASFGRRGSDGSGKYVRFYDKLLESKGQIDAVRFECEFSGMRANLVFEDLIDAEDDDQVLKIMSKRLGGCIDFADRNGSCGHKDRFKRVAWWERIVALLGSAPMVVTRTKTNLQKAAEWHKKQYSKTVAKIARVAESCGMQGQALVMGIVKMMQLDGERDLGDWKPGPGDEVDFGSLLRSKVYWSAFPSCRE